MILDFVLTVFALLVITYVGYILYTAIYRGQLNGYLQVAISFALGNLIMIIVLSILIVIGALHFTVPLFCILSGLTFLHFLLHIREYRKTWKVSREALYIGIAIFMVLAAILAWELLSPMRVWDARAIWLIKAKVFYFAKSFDNAYLSHENFSHTHRVYPNGLSHMMALFFRLYGAINEQAVKIYIISFYLNVILIAVGTIKHFFKKVPAYMVILIIFALLFSERYVRWSATGYADVPLSLAISVSVLCLALATLEKTLEKNIRKVLSLLVVGALSGMLALAIKDEGSSFFLIYSGLSVILVLCRFKVKEIISFAKKNILATASAVGLFLLGLFPAVSWAIAKSQMGLPQRVPFDFSGKLPIDYYREILMIINHSIKVCLSNEYWGLLIVPVSLLFVGVTALLLLKKGRRYQAIPGLVAAAQSFVYFLVYLYTKYDLNWHLASSQDRLYLHLVPAMIIVVTFYLYLLNKDRR